MGKIRVKALGDESLEQEQEQKVKKRKEAKKLEKAQASEVEKQEQEEKKVDEAKPEQKQADTKEKKTEKAAKKAVARIRSKKYNTVKASVHRNKKYKLAEALDLLPQIHLSSFDETVELHVNTTEPGISGNLNLPHGTGKKTKVAVADDAVLAKIEKGVVDFDVLVATPDMMPKLAKVAKVLGPKGLMPNPKSGTITTNPEEVVKKYEGGQMRFKTESKIPVIHLTVGKLSFGNKKLSENIETALKAIQTAKIRSAILKSTMSPGIKIEVVASA